MPLPVKGYLTFNYIKFYTMNLENKYIDELIVLREEARQLKNWKLADDIRAYLDTKHIFVFDKKDEQVVYHRTEGSRQDLINSLKKECRAERIFDAWLFSIKQSINRNYSKLQTS